MNFEEAIISASGGVAGRAWVEVSDADPSSGLREVAAATTLSGWSWLEQTLMSLRTTWPEAGVSLRWRAGEPGTAASKIERDHLLAIRPYQPGPRVPRQITYTVEVPSERREEMRAVLPAWHRTSRSDRPAMSTFSRTRDDGGADATARELVSLVRRLDMALPGRDLMVLAGPVPDRTAADMAGMLADACGVPAESRPDVNDPRLSVDVTPLPGRIREPSRAPADARLSEIEGRLAAMVGAEPLKDEVKRLKSVATVERRRKDAGLGPSRSARHLLLTGPAGTGTSTGAGILADLYGALDLLPQGQLAVVDPDYLYAGGPSDAVSRTVAAFEAARGGTLLVEDADTLASPELPVELVDPTVDTFVRLMDSQAGDTIVLLAGKPSGVQRLLTSYPALRSRLVTSVELPALTVDERVELFRRLAKAGKYTADEELFELLRDRLEVADGTKVGSTGSTGGSVDADLATTNARAIRRLYESTIEAQAHRLAPEATGDLSQLSRLTADDLPVAAPPASTTQSARQPGSDQALKDALSQLDNLVGLTGVKSALRDLVDLARVTRMRHAGGVNVPARGHHLVLLGNPGTGKTTVAELLGRIFAALGVLSSGHVYTVTRRDLVAGYVGHTAQRTRMAVEAAMGGVLFVDEAYALSTGDSRDFGAEAVAELLVAMERNRDDLVVVVAGYPAPMAEFLESNPGLRSRFSQTITFPDLSAADAVQVVERFSADAGLELADGTDEALLRRFTPMVGEGEWASARTARTVFEDLLVRQARRLVGELELAELTGEEMDDTERARRARVITPDDVPTVEG